MLSVLAFEPLSGLATPFASHWDDLRAKHTWNSVLENWLNLGHPPAGTTIDLPIALKAQNENALYSHVPLPLVDKAHTYFLRGGMLELANAWLEHYGVHPSTISTKHGGSWLTLTAVPVSRASEPLSASYQLYQYIGTNEMALRTLSYGPPAVVLEHVQNVAPTTHFEFPRTLRQESLMRRGMERTKTSTYVPLAADRNVLGVAGSHADYPSPDDLKQFMNQFRFDATSATYSVVKIKGGGHNPTSPTIEANLNIQYTSVIAYPTPHIFYSTGDLDTQGDGFMYWLDYVLGLWRVPQTVTMPYSMPERNVPPDCATYACNLFARLGVRGASVLTLSGNNGVGSGDCLFQESSGNSRVQFLPTFPSTCPWDISVGRTTGYNPEVAASRCIFHGRRARTMLCPPPSGTSAASITTFTTLGGRGIPDIALQAINFRIILSNEPWNIDGTSCSTPTAAGIISLLNDYRISNGKAPLGFLNVWLYGICLEGLNDITSGFESGLQYRWILRCPWVGSCVPSRRWLTLDSMGHGSRVTRL
ncbi:subtilisin-like protein [Lactarius vividus]|nr:subtilisin-like protein [Lactarius vividus]